MIPVYIRIRFGSEVFRPLDWRLREYPKQALCVSCHSFQVICFWPLLETGYWMRWTLYDLVPSLLYNVLKHSFTTLSFFFFFFPLNSLNSTLCLSDISRDSPVSFSLPEMLSSCLTIFSFPDGKNNKVKPHH